MEEVAQHAMIKQSVYGAEHPCHCVPSEYCHWQCICDDSEKQGMKEERINISSGEDVILEAA